jgi:transposase InsO family protein/transposase-like protein
MRYTQAEKMEVIRLVEESAISVRRTLQELGINRSAFYAWYRKYVEDGYEGLSDQKPQPNKFWNRIPPPVKDQVVEIALNKTDLSPRELAWHITDENKYFISESSVYRILKSYDLITSPAYIVISAADHFNQPTKGVHELWQTDFSYFRIIGWGWYYLSTVMDDYSRYILAWKLSAGMAATDVMETLDMARERAGIDRVKVRHRPRLLSDNGPCYLSRDLKEYLENRNMLHTRGARYHPQTQGKIERYHRSIKNVFNLQHYYLPGELEREITRFVEYYNNHRYHESLDNLTPADVYFGRKRERLTVREMIKHETMKLRRIYNLEKGDMKNQLQLTKITP